MAAPCRTAQSPRYCGTLLLGRQHSLASGQGPNGALSCLDFHDDATVDLEVAHAAEDAVDVFQPLGRVVDLHFAVARELQALGEIESRPHDRSPNSLAHQNGVEDVQFERTRWQANEGHGTPLAEHAESLAERFG